MTHLQEWARPATSCRRLEHRTEPDCTREHPAHFWRKAGALVPLIVASRSYCGTTGSAEMRLLVIRVIAAGASVACFAGI